MKRSEFALIEAQGLATIADGREFMVRDTYPPGRYPTALPTSDNEAIALSHSNGQHQVERVIPIAEDSPCSCEHCGNLFERYMLEHNGEWMYTFFNCSDHPGPVALLDVFPKRDGYSTGWDWENAFIDLGLPRPPKGVVVTTSFPMEDLRRRRRERAQENRYLLTPNGLEPVRSPKRGFLAWFTSK